MQVEIKDGKIVITMDYDRKGTPSKSGKTMVHASTRGNLPVSVKDGKDNKILSIGVNAYSK